MTVDEARPWLALYPEGVPADLVPEYTDALRMFRAGVERDPDGVAVSYFGGEITRRQLDAQSDALASAFVAHGRARGDRVGAYLQNVPQFVIPAELVLGYRFDAGVLLDAIRERRPTFTVAAITVSSPSPTRPASLDLASLRSTYSGGAPVTPA